MSGADPARALTAAKAGAGELALRVGSSLVLVPLAVGAAYLGGWVFVVFWGLAAVGVLWEWTALVAGQRRPSVMRSVTMAGGASVVLALALARSAGGTPEGMAATRLLAAVIVLGMGMLGVVTLAPRGHRAWVAAGIPYAGAIGIAPIVLRLDNAFGFVAVLFLFAVVWGTDIVAYFVGRAVGGPKLAPLISPKKTWSGAVAGTACAVVVALVFARLLGSPSVMPLMLVAVAMSVAAQAGDLFESGLKRRFGAKDSGRLIPGHGGLMDRLDGFAAAGALAAVIGLVRGGIDAPARALLMW